MNTITDVQLSRFNRWLPPVLCIFLVVYYFIVSLVSAGYYQHDEVSHLMQIQDFWRTPLLYLTDPWSRGGFKVLYAVPALLGNYAIVAMNIFFVAGAAWFSYRIARVYELKCAWLAILLTGLQPFAINLAFRCYPEIPAMFFITLLVYLYITKRWIGAAIVASFLFTIRAELVVFALLAGGFFLLRKQWIPFLCLGIAPVILNLLGFWLQGDPLYVWHLMVQGGLKDTYQRSGFFYFWLMMPEISGIIVIFLFISGYLSIVYRFQEKWNALKKYHVVIIVFTVYFLLHCAFTAKSFGFGRSGGVGRFMLVVLPMVSVIALIGVNFFIESGYKWYKLLVACMAFVLLLVLFARLHAASSLVFDGYATIARKWLNIVALAATFLLAVVLILQARASKLAVGFVAFVLLGYTLLGVKTFPPTGEDKNMEAAVSWLREANITPRRLYINHPVAHYAYARQVGQLWKARGFGQQTIAQATPGDVFLVEMHYTDGLTRRQIFSSHHFKVIRKIVAGSSKYPAWVMQRQ